VCLFPKLIKNRKYVVNNKNGGDVPIPNDHRVLMVPIGCGRCMECLKQKSRQWSIRLNEEIRVNTTGKFVTLSFSDEEYWKIRDKLDIKLDDEYYIDNAIATYAVRHFLENWRSKHKKSVKHWLVTELGQNKSERIHLHGIIFTDMVNEITSKWKYGNVFIGSYCNEASVNYIVKYLSKSDPLHTEYKPITLCSPGIGKSYCDRLDFTRNNFNGNLTREWYSFRNGSKANLPIYYRNKAYSDEEREFLWLKKLDENVRYVDGQKISVNDANGLKNYYNCLSVAQAKNKRLGYGDDTENWDVKRYENERRSMLRKKK
jgi:hypothetical protein